VSLSMAGSSLVGRTGIAFSRPGGYGDADHSKVLLIADPKTTEPAPEVLAILRRRRAGRRVECPVLA
jgi:hypothetical protein